ncbi:MAG: type II toxin-antitoxin system HicA family toxin [Planctomycetota bacterium]
MRVIKLVGIYTIKYRDIIRLLEQDGWQLSRITGSHLQYQHPVKKGTVTVSAGGKLGRDIPPGTKKSILRQAGLE